MDSTSAPGIRVSSAAGRWVLAATILGSGMAMLDGTVVNVALRRIGADLHASLGDLQWITNGYMLSLASLILLGGALGDRYGRRKVFTVGVIGFAAASLVCGLAPNVELLIGARIVAGIAAAMLTPGSLALIQGAIVPADRARAIGTWSGLGGVTTAIGPFVGGWLVEYASWRWVFFINLPLAVLTLLAARKVPETRDQTAAHSFDVPGAVLGTVALAGLTYALIEWSSRSGVAAGALAVGVVGGIAFVLNERRRTHPMVPPELFASRQFSAANAMTLLTYAALGAVMFFLVLQLQTVAHYAPLSAGLATLPVTIVMVLLAGRGGALAARIGPRIPMTVGPMLCAIGAFWLARVDAGVNYWIDVALPVTVFGLGLAALVAPLTATVLAAAPDRRAGVASGVNNAVARAGSLLSVSALPLLVGLSGDDYSRPDVFSAGYRTAMWWCAGLLVAGGLLSWLTIRSPRRASPRIATQSGHPDGENPARP